MIGYDEVMPETLDFGDHVGKPWSDWRAADAGGIAVEVRHTHNLGGKYVARTVDAHAGKRFEASCTGAWKYAAARAANKLVEARAAGKSGGAEAEKPAGDDALSGEIVPAGSYSPKEYADLMHIPEETRRALINIRRAAADAALAVARLCELLHRSRTYWPEAGEGEWAWRQAIESECGIAAPLAAKMAHAWETVLRYPAWEAALRETRDAWDLETLTTTANTLREKDPDGELADDADLAAAFAVRRRALRQRRVKDFLRAFEARRIAEARPELDLDGGEAADSTPAGGDPFLGVAEFDRDARRFMESAREIRAHLPEAGPMRDRLALMTDRVAGVVDDLAEALGAEDF